MSDDILNDDFKNTPTSFAWEVSDKVIVESIKAAKNGLASGAKFTNAQMDICAEVVITQLPEHEREWIREIATSNGYPLWLALLAQWRRCNEYGECAALLVDVDWIAKVEEDAPKVGR